MKKREGESVESLLRRFTKKLQQSGKLLRVKRGQFYQSPKNKREQREDALRRKELRETKEYLRKIGKLDDIRDGRKVALILKKEIKQKNSKK